MRYFSRKTSVLLAASLALIFTSTAAAANRDVVEETLLTTRTQDRVTLYAGTGYLSLNEVVVLTPIKVPRERERPGAFSIVNVLISPLWIKEGESHRLAFPSLRPLLTLSHGRVRRFALVQSDGETVRSITQATPDSRYLLTLEVGHVIPERFTVTINLSAGGIRPEYELIYTPSNDSQPQRSGPPESFYTDFRLNADGALGSWEARQGEKVLPPNSSSTIRMDRDVPHTIQFGLKPQ